LLYLGLIGSRNQKEIDADDNLYIHLEKDGSYLVFLKYIEKSYQIFKKNKRKNLKLIREGYLPKTKN
jgi:hypothetical protein